MYIERRFIHKNNSIKLFQYDIIDIHVYAYIDLLQIVMNVDCISCVFSSERQCLLQTKIQTSKLNTNKQQTMMTCAKPRWGWGSGKWDHFRSEVANGSAAHLQSLATGSFPWKKLVFFGAFLIQLVLYLF